ncbi:MAG: hypothetical protein PVG66_03465 [Chromatiales bacterium]|jgi:hypothetical protein
MELSNISSHTAKTAVILSTLLLYACNGNNVRFTNTAAPPLPSVVPEPQEFKLTLAVENKTQDTFPVGSLKVKVDALYHTDYTSETCFNNLDFPLRRLEPDQKVVMQSIEFEKNEYAGDPCRCLKGSCAGHVKLKLTNSADVLQPGPQTHFQVTWKKSGELSDLSVVDQSD